MIDQSDRESHPGAPIDRRSFLGAGAGVLATTAALGTGSSALGLTAAPDTKVPLITKRVLGRTGVEVSMLNLGTWKSVGLDRILRFAWASGIRYIDTAKSYGSEPGIAKWLQAMPEVRKDLFLVTKDSPAEPKQLLKQLDERLANLKTDYIDLIFIHHVGDHDINTEINWPNSKEFKETAEAIRKSGKARFVGFSTHHKQRPEILQNAAKGGFVDAIMVQNDPWLAQEDSMNRALDACHKAGIGLISMKQVAGNPNLEEIARRLPELKEQGLSPYQRLLHAIWTDERFSSVCVSMRNTDQVRENSQAARIFKPMTKAEIHRLKDACIAAGQTLCASCDGRCSRAAGTEAELGNITRFLTYHEHHGYRGEARRLYAGMNESARNWAGADLDAARHACPNKLDFANLLPKAERILA
jgi:aryl-alcohol dehydrogenase-like predicted oxidoreductase